MRRIASLFAWPWVGAWVIGAVLALGVIGYDRTPITWADEVFYAEPARVLAAEGRLASHLFGPLRGIEEHFYLQPPLSFVERALVFKTIGFGKSQVRIAGLAEFIAAIALLAAIMRRLAPGGTPYACGVRVLTVAIFACDAGIVEAAHSGRPDLLAISLVLLSFLSLMLTEDREDSSAVVLFAASGVTGALAVLSHPVMGVFLPAAFIFASHGGAWRRIVAWFSGLLPPFVLWWYFIALDLGAWRAQFLSHVSSAAIGKGVWSASTALGAPFVHASVNAFEYFKTMPTALLLCVPVYIGFKFDSTRHARLLGLHLLCCLGVVAFEESFIRFGVVFVYLVCGVALASNRVRIYLATHSTVAVWGAVLLCANYAAIPVARTVAVIFQWDARSERPLHELVALTVPTGAMIIGHQQGYFAALANGSPFMYSSPFQGLRIPATPTDRAAFEDAVNSRRPSFALLRGSESPNDVLGWIIGAAFLEVGRYDPSMPSVGVSKVGYDLRLWRINYSPDRQID